MRPPYGSIFCVSANVPMAYSIDGLSGEQNFNVNSNILNTCYDSAYNSDRSLLVIGSSASPHAIIYDTTTDPWSQIVSTFTPAINGYVYSIDFSPDDSLIAIGCTVSPYIKVYNTADWSQVSIPAGIPSNGNGVAFSPDGTKLAVAHNSPPYITAYNTADWSKITSPVDLPPGSGKSCKFSQNGALLAVASDGSPYVTIYNTSDWTKITGLTGSNATCVSFSPDGSKLLVTYVGTGGFKIYNTADWSVFATTTSPHYCLSCDWLNNDVAVLGTDTVPGVMTYTLSTGTFKKYNATYNINGLNVVRDSTWEITGTISESLAADNWIARVYDEKTGVYIGKTLFTGVAFSVQLSNPTPVTVTVSADQGAIWEASKTNIEINDKVFPTDPTSTPYYYIATAGGTTGATEPVWPVTAGGSVVDGSVTWQRVERLIQPVTQSPLMPTVKP